MCCSSCLAEQRTAATSIATSECARYVALGRADVYHVAGTVMVQLGISVEEAMVRLRADSSVRGRRLIDLSRDFLARTLCLDDNTDGNRSRVEERS